MSGDAHTLSPVAAWLLREGWRIPRSTDLVDELCRRPLEQGVPLWRFSLFFRTLHPEVFGDRFQWRRDTGITLYDQAHRFMTGTSTFASSPLVILAKSGEPFLRRRLADPAASADSPLLADLAAEGATDYFAMPMRFQDGSTTYLTTSTNAPWGFSDVHIERLLEVGGVLARVAEGRAVRSVATRLLDLYVGRDAGNRIMAGQVLRGSGETIRAAIWFSDLRGFTALSERLSRDDLIATLNGFFDRMAGPVVAAGGEVLKFIGDAMLAIFPVRDGDDATAARKAIGAARAALARMAGFAGPDGEPLRCGIALHLGEVIYGNVGAATRLDFTVIGPAVNLAARIGGQCRALDADLLVSQAVAMLLDEKPPSAGRHRLAGLAEPVEIFRPPLS
jgi:adenylate cyclase